MVSKIIFDELKLGNDEIVSDVLDELFDNKCDGKLYIVKGSIGLWDGVREGYYPRVAESLKEAILFASEGFGLTYTRVVEEGYGKLFVEVSHHDGFNRLEVRELSGVGEELFGRWGDVGVDKIVSRRGATRNVHYLKNH